MYNESPPRASRTPWRHTNAYRPTAGLLLAPDGVDAISTVRDCAYLSKNRAFLRNWADPLKLFLENTPLESVGYWPFGPRPKSRSGFSYIIVILEGFTKLVQVVPLRLTRSVDFSQANLKKWVYKYGPLKKILSDNEEQYISKSFQSVCQLLAITNVFISTYHPLTNKQVERYNQTLTAMLRCYDNDHQ